jgi:hypothetical protein
MELTPENDIYLSPTEIDAQFEERGMLAHFQNTCKARTVKVPKEERRWQTPQWLEHRIWEHNVFRDENDVPQCRYKIKRKIAEGEEEIGKNVHIVWYRDTDGKKYVAVTVDASRLEIPEAEV